MMADTLQKMQTPSLREKVAAWEAKNNPVAALTSNQRDTFIELTTHSSNRPLPLEVNVMLIIIFDTVKIGFSQFLWRYDAL